MEMRIKRTVYFVLELKGPSWWHPSLKGARFQHAGLTWCSFRGSFDDYCCLTLCVFVCAVHAGPFCLWLIRGKFSYSLKTSYREQTYCTHSSQSTVTYNLLYFTTFIATVDYTQIRQNSKGTTSGLKCMLTILIYVMINSLYLMLYLIYMVI